MNIYRFIPNKISALLFTLICVLTLAACAGGGGGGGGGSNPPSPLNLRIIPDTNNATLIWNNPDMDIANISISYKNSTAANFEDPIIITDNPTIARNTTDVRRMISEGSLTRNTIYTFRVALEFGGADENKSIIAEEIRRQIGPNLDQDEYADADVLEMDEDGDGVNDEQDGFPRNAALSNFTVAGLIATPGAGNVTLSWNNPDADIASINISYEITGSNDVQYWDLITPPAQMETITGLTNGQSYTFNISLTLQNDDAGREGEAASDTATPNVFSVTGLTATPGAGNVTLSWNNPDADIASINISYEITGSNNVQYWDLITPPAQMETITGLTNGQSYTFNISLTLQNDDAGREGEAASDTATPNVFSVIDLTATPGNGNVTLRWTNPTANISSISIRYGITGSSEFTTVGTSNTGRGASVEQTIDGLDNEVSYTFTVSLTLTGTDAGREGPAPSATATPAVFSVTDLVAAPGAGNVTLSWNNPAADIASISISYQRDGSTLEEFPTITDSSKRGKRAMGVTQMIPGLTNEEYYTFTVDLTLEGDDTGREGTAASIRWAIGPDDDGDGYADFLVVDDDGDGIANFLDVDDDGDGLIEIATAEQLNQVREVLSGVSFAGNNTGCGGLNDISECNGYELTQNISLDGYNGDNWVPIGSCGNLEGASQTVCTTASSLFNTTFDGNGWTISNLTITNPAAPYNNGAGLFGAISPDSVLRNVHLRSANISQDGTNVGLLVGYAQGARISNSSAEGEVMATGRDVGGLVGDGVGANITSSYVTGGSISGFSGVGGLIGAGDFAMITSSYAMDITVLSESNNAGGLIGTGNTAMITSSYVVGGSVMGLDRVGGMTGSGNGINITLSYVAGLFISGRDNVGGMVGGGSSNGIITSSYVGGGVDIIGTNINIGGMIGSGDGATIKSSYSTADTISGSANVGGMLGFGSPNDASSNSYWNSETSGITGGSVADKSEGKTTDELQMPTTFIGIYATWEDDLCADGTAAWDLGLNNQYPALNCTPNGLTPQRP